MPRYTQQCLTCAWRDDIIAQPFQNPVCPRCGGPTDRLWVGSSAAVQDDSYIGGLTLENYGPNPVTFYSKSERLRYMKEHGLSEAAAYRTAPGTDRNAHGMVRWDAYPDAQTLANAQALVERVGGVAAEEPRPGPLETFRMEVRDVGRFRVTPE
jgi:hypothetical protein